MYNAVLLYKPDNHFAFLMFFFLKMSFPADGAVKVLNTVLEKTNADLKSLRMSVFKELKPKLRCKLGENSEYHGMQ